LEITTMGYLSLQIHQSDRPRVVVLCGSTRFKTDFEATNRTLTLAGHIVLAPGVFGHADGIQPTDAEKTALDELHLRKIDLADEVIVVSPGGYIGDSTRSEIAYAERIGKPVGYLDGSPTT
jgi:dienelactone hydrolase